jgi:hypothetical protein
MRWGEARDRGVERGKTEKRGEEGMYEGIRQEWVGLNLLNQNFYV